MKTNFLITVDVETRDAGNPRSDIFGVLPGYEGNYGIGKIMDLLEAQQVRGSFFLNVYETAKYAEEEIAAAAKLIHSRGHDLELHTHPLPMYQYYSMSKYSTDEQVVIIKKGLELIENWTNKRVVAHRAGAFSANLDTLRACERAGLWIDSSLSPGSRVQVPLVKELGASNMAQRAGKLWEIPVTFYNQIHFGKWNSKRILDIEGSSLAEIKRVTLWALEHRLPTVCMLMHSFSLSRNGRPNQRVIRRLATLLTWLKNQDYIHINTIECVSQILTERAYSVRPSQPPHTGWLLTGIRALYSWNDGWKNRVVAATSVGIVIVFALVLSYLGYKYFS